MAIKFFGHFLLDEGFITSQELTKAVDYQASVNLSLGQLAVRESFISEKEATKINEKQQSLDKRFGEVAESLGLLSSEQIEKLLSLQRSEKIFFGDVLIRMNFMDEEQLNEQLARFEHLQKLEVVELNESIIKLDKEDIIKEALGVFQTLFLRIAHEPIKLLSIESENVTTDDGILVLQKMRGDKHLNFALQADDSVSLSIAQSFLKMECDSVDEMVIDAMAEFVNIVLGNISVKLSRDNVKVDLTPPAILDTSLFTYKEYVRFDFVTTKGLIHLYLAL